VSADRHPASYTVAENDLAEADCEASDLPASNGWWCLRCSQRHRHGEPFDGCPDCGFLLGEES